MPGRHGLLPGDQHTPPDDLVHGDGTSPCSAMSKGIVVVGLKGLGVVLVESERGGDARIQVFGRDRELPNHQAKPPSI